jgi:hypothetical protein
MDVLLERLVDRLGSVLGLGDDLHVRLGVEDLFQARADDLGHGAVARSNRRRSRLRACLGTRTRIVLLRSKSRVGIAAMVPGPKVLRDRGMPPFARAMACMFLGDAAYRVKPARYWGLRPIAATRAVGESCGQTTTARVPWEGRPDGDRIFRSESADRDTDVARQVDRASAWRSVWPRSGLHSASG